MALHFRKYFPFLLSFLYFSFLYLPVTLFLFAFSYFFLYISVDLFSYFFFLRLFTGTDQSRVKKKKMEFDDFWAKTWHTYLADVSPSFFVLQEQKSFNSSFQPSPLATIPPSTELSSFPFLSPPFYLIFICPVFFFKVFLSFFFIFLIDFFLSLSLPSLSAICLFFHHHHHHHHFFFILLFSFQNL